MDPKFKAGDSLSSARARGEGWELGGLCRLLGKGFLLNQKKK